MFPISHWLGGLFPLRSSFPRITPSTGRTSRRKRTTFRPRRHATPSRKRSPRLERLDDRRLLAADLSLNNVRLLGEDTAALATTDAPSLTSTPDGALAAVRVDFGTMDLPAGSQYRVRFTLDNSQVWTSNDLNWNAGVAGASTAYYWQRLWPLAPGWHTIQVQLDPLNQIGEANELNNVGSISFFTGGGFQSIYYGETQLATPLAGIPNWDWFITGYVDRDADHNPANKQDPATKEDYTGGEHTYSGHEGTDFGLANFAAQDEGLPVLAAASGKVIAVRDGEFDRQTTSNNLPSNMVVIDHGNGWTTQYLHLRRDSVAVSVGDIVHVGDRIGLVGSSGSSTGAHLHFDLRYQGLYVDPFAAAYWKNPLPYSPSVFGVYDFGTTDHQPTAAEMKNRPVEQEVFRPKQTVVFWTQLHGTQPGDTLRFMAQSPSGKVTFSNVMTSQGGYGEWFYTLNPTEVGLWRVELRRNGFTEAADSFRVSNNASTLAGTIQFPNTTEYYVTENSREAVLTLARGGSVGTSVVHWRTESDTAFAGQDFTAASGSVTFLAGERQKTIRIPLTNDNQTAELERFRVQLTAGTNAWLGVRSFANVNVIDDDAPVSSFTNDGLVIFADGEGGQDDLVELSHPAAGVEAIVNGRRYVVPHQENNAWAWVSTGDGEDFVRVREFRKPLAIATGNDADEIFVGAGELDKLTGDVHVVAGAGADRLWVDDGWTVPAGAEPQPNEYTVTDALVTRRNLNAPAAQPFQLEYHDPVEHLIVVGSLGANRFDVASTRVGVTTTLAGGPEDDVFDVQDANGRLDAMAGPLQLGGGGGRDTVHLHDAQTAGQLYSLSSTGLDRSGGVSIDFEQITDLYLTAGQGDDYFELYDAQNMAVRLWAQDGVDTLSYSTYATPVRVDLAAGEATDLAFFEGIENVTGGSADDELYGDDRDNVLRGLDGGDTLHGRGGRDLLLAGLGADTLLGGADEDLVAGGALLYEQEHQESAIDLIAAEWRRRDLSYAGRVDHLLHGGGLNGELKLDRTTFLSDPDPSQLTGDAPDLDLFYGSRIRDAHDWNKGLHEVFIDPEAAEKYIRIDATALAGTYLFVDYVAHHADTPFNVELTPGQHFFYTYGSSIFYFTVDAEGRIDYDPALEGVLSGRGGGELHINGVAVTIDATALSGSYLFMDYAAYDRASDIHVNLLPGESHFFYTYGSSYFYFTVDAAGNVDYDTTMDAFVSGRGSNELRIQGVAVTIDATALSGSYLFMDYAAYDRTSDIHVNLLPGPSHFFYTYGSSYFYFRVDANGQVDYDPDMDDFVAGRGGNELVVRGVAVTIDATALSGSYLFMDYAAYERATKINVNLLPGESHFFYTYGSSYFYFRVDADGNVGYDAAMDNFVSGRNSNELRIQGVAVTIDATALSGSYLFMDYAAYDRATKINVNLLPGESHFFYTYGSSYFYFRVDADGNVGYDAAMDNFVSGRNSNELRVTGLAIEIDATASGNAHVYMDYAAYDATAKFTAVLLPGQHFLYTASGQYYYFTVTNDGFIDYDPALEGIFNGRGTKKLGFAGAK